MSLPRYVVVLHSGDGDEVVWPKRYQCQTPHETWNEYEKWLDKFLENYKEEAELYENEAEGVALVLYRLKGVKRGEL